MVKICEVGRGAPNIEAIAKAAAIVRAGGLVVYPTETVYGLGADACSDKAVAKVFVAKVRPLENPISIAVGSLDMACRFTELTPQAEAVFRKLMPGPITVILRAKPAISKLITAGTGKVGVRVPDHPVAQKLLDFVGSPITSTSANLSGKPAPSTTREALNQLGKSVDLALDAGECKFGVPSTVVDLTEERFKILREGPITHEEIAKVLKT